MDKEQSIHSFWNSFGLPAYDENTVPSTAGYPRITYNVQTDSLDATVALNASLWYKSSSWRDITEKAHEIERVLGEHGGVVIELDNGYTYLTKGEPFINRMSDPDDTLRRIYINYNAQFLTAY